jgi:MerR family transcriptional regulator/heat shock protein HspR
MDEKNRPKYSISVVAKMFDIHPQTLRLYEREGLMKPQRTERNTRMYCDNDVERLKSILNLTQEMGVNLAGVEVVLRMREQMQELREQIKRMRTGLEELLQKLHDKIQSQFTEGDYAELAGIVPVGQRKIEPVEFEEDEDDYI